MDLNIGHFCATRFAYTLAVKAFEQIQNNAMQMVKGFTLQQFDQITFFSGMRTPIFLGHIFTTKQLTVSSKNELKRTE